MISLHFSKYSLLVMLTVLFLLSPLFVCIVVFLLGASSVSYKRPGGKEHGGSVKFGGKVFVKLQQEVEIY